MAEFSCPTKFPSGTTTSESYLKWQVDKGLQYNPCITRVREQVSSTVRLRGAQPSGVN